jgi:TPR repeat protein
MSEKSIAEKIVQADSGDREAQVELAFFFARDPGARDYVKAHSYYTKAANSGSSIAQHNLACMYLNGDGCQKNLELARHWFEQAATQGDCDAQFNLGLMYTDPKLLVQDDSKAFHWFQMAAENGSARGQFTNMGEDNQKTSS